MKKGKTYRVTVVDDGPYTRIDNRLQQRPRVPHPVTGVREVEVDVCIAHNPCGFSADLCHKRLIVKVWLKSRRVRVRIETRDIVRIVWSQCRIQNCTVAEILCRCANFVLVPRVAGRDLHRRRRHHRQPNPQNQPTTPTMAGSKTYQVLTSTRLVPGICCRLQDGRRHKRVVPSNESTGGLIDIRVHPTLTDSILNSSGSLDTEQEDPVQAAIVNTVGRDKRGVGWGATHRQAVADA